MPGVGEKAAMTKYGLMVKVPGKPYFLHVMGKDQGKGTELAKAVIAGAK